MLAATIAFSIDAILPALPDIGAELAPAESARLPLVIVSFLVGMGVGTVIAGPLSDAFGRKRVMLGGAALYSLSAAAATVMADLDGIILARLLQGLGAAGPRVVAIAMVRDLYQGRGMARIISYSMMVFTLVPGIAPLIGAGISASFGWRGVFWSFVAFSLISSLWLALRQPETLPTRSRRPLRVRPLWQAAREVVSAPDTRRALMAQTLVFAILFATIISIQQIYDQTFDRAASFPLWFGGIALLSGLANLLNARLVGRLGMVWLIRRAIAAHLGLSLVLVVFWLAFPDLLGFEAFVAWQFGTFAMVGFAVGNLNALALVPLGHVAGMASSIVSSAATVGAAALAAPVGLLFDGTPLPLALASALFAALASLLIARLTEAEEAPRATDV
ncbi:MFS transporter [Jannaschia aquimarina]|nr:MFS transporter [Jannaschia aquimarina]